MNDKQKSAIADLSGLKDQIEKEHWLNVHFRAFRLANEAWANHAAACAKSLPRDDLFQGNRQDQDKGPNDNSHYTTHAQFYTSEERVRDQANEYLAQIARNTSKPPSLTEVYEGSIHAVQVSYEMDGHVVTKRIENVAIADVQKTLQVLMNKESAGPSQP